MSHGFFLTAILSCYNRREKTLTLLRTLESAMAQAGVAGEVVVYDDGSSDGTSDAIAHLYPDATILAGTGSDYWAKSMANAERFALEFCNRTTHLLWLNDDVVLDETSISSAVSIALAHPNAILVGATRDPLSEAVTYSGLVRKGIHPLSFQRVAPGSNREGIDAFNGNFVLVPRHVSVAMGGIDPGYSHSLADIDYGMRATRKGHAIMVLPETIGTCPRNVTAEAESIWEDWRLFIGIKGGGHPHSMLRYLKRFRGVSGWVFALATYGKWWLTKFVRIVGGARGRARASIPL